MQEFTTPPAVELDASAALPDAVRTRAEQDPDTVVFTRKVDGRWAPVTAKEFATEVASVAAGLVSSGVQPGDRVGLMSKTRYEWTLCDYAIWTAGAVTVPIYETSSAEQVQWNLGDSGAVGVIVESAAHQEQLDEVRGQLPDLTGAWQIDAGGLEELAAAGRDVPEAELEARRATLGTDSLATIIYTSGTTGRPKGCELTHGNLLGTGRSASLVLPELFNPRRLDAAVPAARARLRAAHPGGLRRERRPHGAHRRHQGPARPTSRPSSRRSSCRCRGCSRRSTTRPSRRRTATARAPIFDRAEKTAIAYSEALDEAGSVGLPLKLQHAVFDQLVYSKLRAAMGGKVAWAVSGGAPLGARLGHFFRGIGITILEGYGLTETTAAGTVNTPAQHPHRHRRPPLPRRHRSASPTDGEILMSRREHAARATGTTRRPPARPSSTAGSTPATSASSTTTAS